MVYGTYSISVTNTLVLKIQLSCVVSIAASIWVFNTSSESQKGSDFLLFIFQQLKEIWVNGKRFRSRKDMLCLFFYKLSMEKIAQCYIFKKLFCRSSARKNYVFVFENNFELWRVSFFFLGKTV